MNMVYMPKWMLSEIDDKLEGDQQCLACGIIWICTMMWGRGAAAATAAVAHVFENESHGNYMLAASILIVERAKGGVAF